MRNFLKTSLKSGIIPYYREHVGTQKYSHAFINILKVKPYYEMPTLSKDEKQYLRTAIWNDFEVAQP